MTVLTNDFILINYALDLLEKKCLRDVSFQSNIRRRSLVFYNKSHRPFYIFHVSCLVSYWEELSKGFAIQSSAYAYKSVTDRIPQAPALGPCL